MLETKDKKLEDNSFDDLKCRLDTTTGKKKKPQVNFKVE